MPSTNDELRRASVRHSVHLNRFAGKVKNDAISLLDEAEEDLIRIINKRESRKVLTKGLKTTNRLKILLQALKEKNAEIHGQLRLDLNDNLKDLAGHEGLHLVYVLRYVVPIDLDYVVPSDETIIAAANSKPFEGQTLAQWSKELEVKSFDQMQRQIKIGFVQGETVGQITDRLIGTDLDGGVFKKIRRNAEAIARTSVNHMATVARDQTYKSNSRFIKGVQWVSTLDGRTTFICMDLDGKVFPIDSGPRPPVHIGERSTTTPVMKSFRELGFDIDELPADTRASMNGKVADTTTSQEFMEGESAKFQDGVFGKTKGKLFRDGGLTVHDFVDEFGQELTIAELRIADSEAFAKAGL